MRRFVLALGLCLSILGALGSPARSQTSVEPASAGPASLVADLNTALDTQPSSMPTSFVRSGNTTYFVASTLEHGYELWKTDGTGAGTMMVKDINPGPGSAFPLPAVQPLLVDLNGALLFWANDGAHGYELWRSDGSPSGTYLLKDFAPGNLSSTASSGGIVSIPISIMDGLAYLSIDDGSHGRELWVTDGTRAGTALVKDINPGPASSSPGAPVKIPGLSSLYFSADDGVHGRELWRTDGTNAGTVLVRDVLPGATGSAPAALTALPSGPGFYFLAQDALGQLELWRSNGTNAGTQREYQFLFTASASRAWVYNGVSVLIVRVSGSDTETLWRTDGTANGTYHLPGSPATIQFQRLTPADHLLYFTSAGGGLWATDGLTVTTLHETQFTWPSHLTAVGSRLYYSIGDGLRVSDGTLTGTVKVSDRNPGGSSNWPDVVTANVNGVLFFLTDFGGTGLELWKSDGTSAGTVQVKDIRPGLQSSSPNQLTNINGTLYFRADDGVSGVEFWISDGSEAGTVLVKDLSRSVASEPRTLIHHRQSIYFYARPTSGTWTFWRHSTSMSAPLLLKANAPSMFFSPPFAAAPYNDQVFFVAYDTDTGGELWRTDGTVAGTSLVRDINPGSAPGLQGQFSRDFVVFGNWLFFSASNNQSSFQLWRTDGTFTNTVLFADISPGQPAVPANFAILEDRLLFTARTNNPPSGTWLHVTDGISEATALQFINRSQYDNIELTVIGSRAVFAGGSYQQGHEPWVTDGTATGTQVLKDIAQGITSSFPSQLTAARNVLYFNADDRGPYGAELWRTDGTEAGTVMVKDIYPGPGGSNPRGLLNVNGILYFTATDPMGGAELWRSDGTEAGTVRWLDIIPGPDSSYPSNLFALPDGRFVFAAFSDATGLELWITDGTPGGTRLLQDIAPGPISSTPSNFTLVGDRVYFTADDGVTGRELWQMPASPGVAAPKRVFLPLIRR